MKARAILGVFITVAIDFAGTGLSLPVLPFYVLEKGGDASSTASLIATFSFFQILSALWMGALADKIGPRPVMLVSVLGSGVGSLLTTLSPNLSGLFVARVVAGMFSGTLPVAQSYLADVCTAEERPKQMAFLGAMPGLVVLLLPPVGSVLTLSPLGLRTPFATATCTSFAALVFAYSTLVTPAAIKAAMAASAKVAETNEGASTARWSALKLKHAPKAAAAGAAPKAPPQGVRWLVVGAICFASAAVAASRALMQTVVPLLFNTYLDIQASQFVRRHHALLACASLAPAAAARASPPSSSHTR